MNDSVKNNEDTHDTIHEIEEGSIDFGEKIYSFTTKEFEEKERGAAWFIVLGIAILLGIVIGIFTDALSLVLVSMMIGVVYTLTYNQQPERINVEFTDIGMKWREKFFTYNEMKKFWIIYIPHEQKTLHVLVMSGTREKEIIIPINSQKINKIKDVLGYYVPEDENFVEPLRATLTRKLKL